MERITEPALHALIEAMYLTAYADGEFADSERAMFASSVGVLTRGRVGEAQLEAILTELERRQRNQGTEACLREIAERLTTDEERQAALILASDIAAADGVLEPQEEKLLQELAEVLEVGEDLVDRVLDGLRARTKPGA